MKKIDVFLKNIKIAFQHFYDAFEDLLRTKKLKQSGKKYNEMTKQELIDFIVSIRPKADCYDRICKTVGIKSNVLGHIGSLNHQIKCLEYEIKILKNTISLQPTINKLENSLKESEIIKFK